MQQEEDEGLPGLSFTAALSQDRAEEAASPPPVPASRRASRAVFSRRTSHAQATPSGCVLASCAGRYVSPGRTRGCSEPQLTAGSLASTLAT